MQFYWTILSNNQGHILSYYIIDNIPYWIYYYIYIIIYIILMLLKELVPPKFFTNILKSS